MAPNPRSEGRCLCCDGKSLGSLHCLCPQSLIFRPVAAVSGGGPTCYCKSCQLPASLNSAAPNGSLLVHCVGVASREPLPQGALSAATLLEPGQRPSPLTSQFLELLGKSHWISEDSWVPWYCCLGTEKGRGLA